MSEFKRKFTKIIGTSDARRLPRLGKIGLGIKVLNKPDKINKDKCTCKVPGQPGCCYCTHPKEVDYFVCPDEVKQAHQEKFPDGKITELNIMFPINDAGAIFPQAYKAYGQTRGLKCTGDGKDGMRYNEEKKAMEAIECKGEECDWYKAKKCMKRAHLFVMLPEVSLGGVYQIDSSSVHSMIDVNSGIDFVKAVAKGVLGEERFALIPLVLKRVEKETHFEGKKQIHYPLQVHCPLNMFQWNELKEKFRLVSAERLALPPVEDVNPVVEGDAVVMENGDGEPEQQTEPEPLAQAFGIEEEIEALLDDRIISEKIRAEARDVLEQGDEEAKKRLKAKLSKCAKRTK